MRPQNTSGPMLKNIQNKLNLIYLNNDEHTHMDRAHGSADINKTNDLILNLTPENVTQHSRTGVAEGVRD